MRIQGKEEQNKPIKDRKTDFKLSEYCPFCKLRRKLQKEIKKLIKQKNDYARASRDSGNACI